MVNIKKHKFSKSTFIRGLQCPKSLYLNKHHKEFRDDLDEQKKKILRTGTNVGILAQELFPGGIDATPENYYEYEKSINHTKQLIDEGAGVIYEAAFQYNGVLCFADILVKEDGKWKVYEVKSSTGVSDIYTMDVSLQYYVITNSGISIDDIFIMHLNNKYVRKGKLALHTLFHAESLIKEVRGNQDFIKTNIYKFKKVLSQKKRPEIDIGEHCYNPYDCDFKGHCWSHIPEYSVFNISRLRKKEAFEMYRNGIIRIEDIPEDYSFGKTQEIQVRCHKTGEIIIDKEMIKEFFNTITYPLYFMDFETFNPAVPLFDDSRPYQMIPFQYSMHYQEDKGSELEHFEFLAHAGADPRKDFIEQLLKDTSRPGRILVYNKSFEITRLKELAKFSPGHGAALESLILRIVDLMVPFQKKYYYTPDMKGSYSIKAVLPALVPELGYDGLEIFDGGMAMGAFENLQHEKDEEKIEVMRKNLLEYCEMDTLAMVRVLGRLGEV